MARPTSSERELHQDINAAIAGTEDEIFREAATGDDSDDIDDDGDTSLEEMGEGLEGDDVDEGDEEDADEDEEAEEDADEDGDAEDDEDEADEEEVGEEEDEEVEAAEEEQPRDQRGRFNRGEPRIPPERLRAASERARREETARRELEIRYATLEARFNDMQARVNAPPPAPREPVAAPVKPDMFVDPEGYERWIIERAHEAAQQNVQRAFQQQEERQRVQFNQRVEQSLANAERGARGFEFRAAYNSLLQLNPQDPQARALVQSIVYSPNIEQALFQWWDETGMGPEFRENLAAQLLGRDAPRRGERNERRVSRERERDDYDRPRHVVRRPQPLRSLNSTSGSSSHRVSDPEMLDGSDGSVFDYATRR